MTEIVRTEGVLGGKARLDGRRISVFQIGEMIVDSDYSPEYIADQLDISLAEVHTALAYYYDHPEEMDAIRQRRRETVERLKTQSKAPDAAIQ
ncbi:DUF433 domain-containing protein [Halalkalicoccus sp. NIPERK01]|uniref:DUF433 domain-containing protein n=1 Tax=Halalkalicoccus sp. NIPERK01 TaxID=3053469 RepID=UPI00256F2A8E|nr:DUF433 domain-containing protein [Halalkalicoccus sp. NIPERK01]MDL5362665.1 DUF433 domain-containing protein [Halalkalicoccus sp. NIPERK01]